MPRIIHPSPAGPAAIVPVGRIRPSLWAIAASALLPIGCGGGEPAVETPPPAPVASAAPAAPTPAPAPAKGGVKNIKDIGRSR